MDITKIDKNFRVESLGDLPVHYWDALDAPFQVTGFPWWRHGEMLHRLPLEFTEKEVNSGALALSTHTSGGAIRFRTDSPHMTIRVRYRNFTDMNHMPRIGSAGFDLYVQSPGGGECYYTTIQPSPEHARETLEHRFWSYPTEKGLHAITLYLPLYSGIQTMEIGLAPHAQVLPPLPQKLSRPILFYGSSITQGGCASRPANNYTTMLCRALDAPQINLGFSGSALGEPALASKIAELELAAFVMDYDYNAPDEAHLAKTHEPFFRILRKAQPTLPILLLSRCSNATRERRDIVKRTYENARSAGDTRVWFLDGGEFFGPQGRNFCTVDGGHPNDLGFYRMYEAVLPVLQEALQLPR